MSPRMTESSQHHFGPSDDQRRTATNNANLSPKNVKLPPSPALEQSDADGDDTLPIINAVSATERLRPEAPHQLSSSESNSRLNITTSATTHSPRSLSPSRTNSRPLSASSFTSPSMQRAHSSPGVDSTGRFVTPSYVAPRRPSSPLGQIGRRRSPLRSAMDDAYPATSSWIGLNIEPNIPEHEELDISAMTLSSVAEMDDSQPSSLSSFSNTFPRPRRRPTSPLHQSASAPSLHARAVSPGAGSGSSSPNLMATRYATEMYPNYSFGSASSMPSTPTSFRSRSPSISSLETIEDTPDAEEAAMIEADEMSKLRAEDGESGGGELRRRSSLELRGSGLRSNKERKRWSVCGAERRADFSLEPIEE